MFFFIMNEYNTIRFVLYIGHHSVIIVNQKESQNIDKCKTSLIQTMIWMRNDQLSPINDNSTCYVERFQKSKVNLNILKFIMLIFKQYNI